MWVVDMECTRDALYHRESRRLCGRSETGWPIAVAGVAGGVCLLSPWVWIRLSPWHLGFYHRARHTGGRHVYPHAVGQKTTSTITGRQPELESSIGGVVVFWNGKWQQICSE